MGVSESYRGDDATISPFLLSSSNTCWPICCSSSGRLSLAARSTPLLPTKAIVQNSRRTRIRRHTLAISVSSYLDPTPGLRGPGIGLFRLSLARARDLVGNYLASVRLAQIPFDALHPLVVEHHHQRGAVRRQGLLHSLHLVARDADRIAC